MAQGVQAFVCFRIGYKSSTRDFDTFLFINESDWLSCCLPSSHGNRVVVWRLLPIKTVVNHTSLIQMRTERRRKVELRVSICQWYKASVIKKTMAGREIVTQHQASCTDRFFGHKKNPKFSGALIDFLFIIIREILSILPSPFVHERDYMRTV